MKIFDKIKDLFTDEVIEEKEEVIEIKEEPKLPSIMREKKEENSNIDKIMSDNDLFKDFSNLEMEKDNNAVNNNFRFPISFEENELLDEKILSNQNVMLREKEKKVTAPVQAPEIYPKKEIKEEKVSTFKVSPVISPVYGILDKNYKKEEVQSKVKKEKDISRNVNKVDFETVRKKAYGSLVDDIKENLSSVKIEEKPKEKDISFFELKEDIKEITLGDAENNYSDFGITIDDYKKKDEDINIVSVGENDKKIEKIDVVDPIIDKNKQDEDFNINFGRNIENDDDIFNLIDNMYKENKEEEND